MSRFSEAVLFSAMASFWALNYVFVKFALNFEAPLYILSFRIGFAAIISLLLFGRSIKIPKGTGMHLKLFVFSLLNITIFMSLWFIGERTVSAGLTAIIVYTYPLYTVILSKVFLRETVSTRILAGLILGFAGVVVLFSGTLLTGDIPGLILLVAGAISWSFGTVFYKKYLASENVWTVNTMQYIYAFPVILVMAILSGPFNFSGMFTYTYLLTTLYMGSFGTVVAYYIYLYLFKHYKATSISSFFFAVPALSLAFSYLILGEVETIITLVGFIIISVGIYLGSGAVAKED